MWNNIPICYPSEARTIDQKAINEFRIPSLLLMEHAAQEFIKKLKEVNRNFKQILIVCGPGNNGGDGFAIARLLFMEGQSVMLVHSDPNHFSIDEKLQYTICQKLSIPMIEIEAALNNKIFNEPECIIDGLFGNGLSRDITGLYQSVVEEINHSNAYVVSIDIPSGLDGTTGNILGSAIQANLTIALDSIKWGELVGEGLHCCGKLECVKIGIPAQLYFGTDQLLTKTFIKSIFPKRSDFLNKGRFGKALMIGGSIEMPGAIAMSANACFHSGIGLLSVFVPHSIQSLIQTKMSFVMSIGAPEADGRFSMDALPLLEKIIDSYSIISIGNGMHKTKATEALLTLCLNSDIPLLVDADGLYFLKHNGPLLKNRKNLIITPHLKEMAELLDWSLESVIKDPVKIAKEFSQQFPNTVLVLKSSLTIIAYQKKLYCLNYPNSALSKGGSGDVLAGIILGLWGWFHDPLKAALCGVYAHSLAAATSSLSPISFTPDDLVNQLSSVFMDL